MELTRLCPHLQTLRIGGFTATHAKSVRRALQSLAPTTQQPENIGSWEDDVGESQQVKNALYCDDAFASSCPCQ